MTVVSCFRLHRVLGTIAIDDPMSVCLSCGFAAKTWLNGSRSCLDWRLLRPCGDSGTVFHTDLMRPLPNYFGHVLLYAEVRGHSPDGVTSWGTRILEALLWNCCIVVRIILSCINEHWTVSVLWRLPGGKEERRLSKVLMINIDWCWWINGWCICSETATHTIVVYWLHRMHEMQTIKKVSKYLYSPFFTA